MHQSWTVMHCQQFRIVFNLLISPVFHVIELTWRVCSFWNGCGMLWGKTKCCSDTFKCLITINWIGMKAIIWQFIIWCPWLNTMTICLVMIESRVERSRMLWRKQYQHGTNTKDRKVGYMMPNRKIRSSLTWVRKENGQLHAHCSKERWAAACGRYWPIGLASSSPVFSGTPLIHSHPSCFDMRLSSSA